MDGKQLEGALDPACGWSGTGGVVRHEWSYIGICGARKRLTSRSIANGIRRRVGAQLVCPDGLFLVCWRHPWGRPWQEDTPTHRKMPCASLHRGLSAGASKHPHPHRHTILEENCRERRNTHMLMTCLRKEKSRRERARWRRMKQKQELLTGLDGVTSPKQALWEGRRATCLHLLNHQRSRRHNTRFDLDGHRPRCPLPPFCVPFWRGGEPPSFPLLT